MDNSPSTFMLETTRLHYVLAFLVGLFAVNVLPHLIHGITGKPFPTPFATPPGRGLSSPKLNVTWALINFLISFSIFYFAKLSQREESIWIAAFVGGVTMAFYLANYFGKLFFQ